SFPSTLTWSRALGCALKFVQTPPLMVTRPVAINSSQWRREPRPAAARKRFKRMVNVKRYILKRRLRSPYFNSVTLLTTHFHPTRITHPASFSAGRYLSALPSIDRAFSKARPVRSALAHYAWRRLCWLLLSCDVVT